MAVTSLIAGHKYRLNIPVGAFTKSITSKLYVSDLADIQVSGQSGSYESGPITESYINIIFHINYGPVIYDSSYATDRCKAYYGTGCSCTFILNRYTGSDFAEYYSFLTDLTPKNVALKDNNGTALYTKTSANLIEGLEEYVLNYLNQ